MTEPTPPAPCQTPPSASRPPVDPLWRVAAIAWAVLWLGSLLLPAAKVLGLSVPGWKVLVTGGLFSGVGFLVMWLANPLALIVVGLVATRRQPPARLGVLAALLALSSIKWLWPLTGVAVGYWVWLASFVCLGVADLWISLRALRNPFG